MRELGEATVNLSVNKDGAEVVDQKPFVIRGHHLVNYAGSINGWHLSPGIIATLATLLILEMRMPALEIKNPNHSIGQSRRKYAEDVIGTSLMQLFRFRKNYSQAFSQFLRLADDYPAEIVEGIPDIICNGCAIGEHCRRLTGFSGGKAYNSLESDRKYTEKLIETLDNLNLPKPTITQEQAYFSDAEPQEVRRIKTTIGVIKQVLKQTDSAFWM